MKHFGQLVVLAAAGVFAAMGGARAQVSTLCPSQATVGGFGYTAVNVAGPLDGSCGANSAVQVSIPASNDYGKLTFSPGAPANYPSPLTLGSLGGASANVAYTTSGSDNPFFMLAFTDPTGSLGQSVATDQILMIEFQATTLSGATLTLDPYGTRFNMYDNTTGTYLQGGQQTTNTLSGWLAAHPALGSQSLDEIRIGMGLTGGNTGPESMTVNSLDVRVPEPASMALLGLGLAGLGVVRRRRNGALTRSARGRRVQTITTKNGAA